VERSECFFFSKSEEEGKDATSFFQERDEEKGGKETKGGPIIIRKEKTNPCSTVARENQGQF